MKGPEFCLSHGNARGLLGEALFNLQPWRQRFSTLVDSLSEPRCTSCDLRLLFGCEHGATFRALHRLKVDSHALVWWYRVAARRASCIERGKNHLKIDLRSRRHARNDSSKPRGEDKAKLVRCNSARNSSDQFT